MLNGSSIALVIGKAKMIMTTVKMIKPRLTFSKITMASLHTLERVF
jgi:hypothetical protein